jgi:hypothetical protein
MLCAQNSGKSFCYEVWPGNKVELECCFTHLGFRIYQFISVKYVSCVWCFTAFATINVNRLITFIPTCMQYKLKYPMISKLNKIYFTLLCFAMLRLPGAGSGIGRAVCQVLAREGAKVIAADQNGMAAQETKGLISGKTNLDKQ